MIHLTISFINNQAIPTLNPKLVPINGLLVAQPVITPDTKPSILLITKPPNSPNIVPHDPQNICPIKA